MYCCSHCAGKVATLTKRAARFLAQIGSAPALFVVPPPSTSFAVRLESETAGAAEQHEESAATLADMSSICSHADQITILALQAEVPSQTLEHHLMNLQKAKTKASNQVANLRRQNATLEADRDSPARGASDGRRSLPQSQLESLKETLSGLVLELAAGEAGCEQAADDVLRDAPIVLHTPVRDRRVSASRSWMRWAKASSSQHSIPTGLWSAGRGA